MNRTSSYSALGIFVAFACIEKRRFFFPGLLISTNRRFAERLVVIPLGIGMIGWDAGIGGGLQPRC